MKDIADELHVLGFSWILSDVEKGMSELNLRRFFLCHWLESHFGFILIKDIVKCTHLDSRSCYSIVNDLVSLGALVEANEGQWKGFGERKAWLVTHRGKLLYRRCQRHIKAFLSKWQHDYINVDPE